MQCSPTYITVVNISINACTCRYVHFDFHRICGHIHFERLSQLYDQIEDYLKKHRYIFGRYIIECSIWSVYHFLASVPMTCILVLLNPLLFPCICLLSFFFSVIGFHSLSNPPKSLGYLPRDYTCFQMNAESIFGALVLDSWFGIWNF